MMSDQEILIKAREVWPDVYFLHSREVIEEPFKHEWFVFSFADGDFCEAADYDLGIKKYPVLDWIRLSQRYETKTAKALNHDVELAIRTLIGDPLEGIFFPYDLDGDECFLDLTDHTITVTTRDGEYELKLWEIQYAYNKIFPTPKQPDQVRLYVEGGCIVKIETNNRELCEVEFVLLDEDVDRDGDGNVIPERLDVEFINEI